MDTSLKISADLQRAIMVRSHHVRSKKRVKSASTDEARSESVFGTKSYRDALQRAFNKAKEQIYFNPDMTNFITLTYADNMQSIEQCLYDVKQLIKKQKRANERLTPAGSGRSKPIKYIFIMEYQKRGALHVHMIANNSFSLQVNKNGYKELKYWARGYSSVLSIKDFDNNFRPYLYLFKYMKKSQRIGKSFVHTSRNLNNYTTIKESQIDLENWRTINMERTETTVNTTNFVYYRNYLQFDDTMALQTNLGEPQQWLEQVKLQSMRELEKILKNHTKR